MAFRPHKGRWTSRSMRTKASTTYTKGALQASDGTDIIAATSSTATLFGICDQTKASSDSTTGRVKMLVPTGINCTMLGDATGTLTAAMEGRGLDLSDSVTVNAAANSNKPVRVVKCLSSTLGEFMFNHL